MSCGGRSSARTSAGSPKEFVAEGEKVVVLTTVKLEGERIESADVLTYNGDVKLVAFKTLGDETVANRVFAK